MMFRRWLLGLVTAACGVAVWTGTANSARAEWPLREPVPTLPKFWYYPYYYFPHNYWPSMGPQWPEPPGAPYMRPPAYMAYPPFKEPHWRYELFEPQHYHHGFHFWLDAF
jgi:hypothetical protein